MGKHVNLDLHDDILESIAFDLAKYEITLTIQKLNWIPVENPEPSLLKLTKGATPFKATKGKRIKILLKAANKVSIDMEPMRETEILWCEIVGKHFALTTVLGGISCDILSFREYPIVGESE